MNPLVSRPRRRLVRLVALGLFGVLLVLAIVACASPTGSSPIASPGASAVASGSPAPSHSATPTPPPSPLAPAAPGDFPLGFISWLFTPLFQAMFMFMAGVYSITGNIGIAIVLLTLLIRGIQIPLFRSQIVSQKRMQMLQPELRELQRRYKGDRARAQQAQMDLYKERGVNPAAGCLPMVLSMFLLIPMYTVIRDGLTNWNPSAMFNVFGAKLIPLTCPNPANMVNGVIDKAKPCIDTHVLGFDVGQAQVLFTVGGFAIGGLALLAAFLQLIQSRMVLPSATTSQNDPTANTQRTMMYVFPLFMLLWSTAPAGLFIYWIVSTVFSIVQQYLIVGWGSMFPLFGWTPAFAADHTPRFPVDMPTAPVSGKSVAETRRKPDDRAASAASTVRPRAQRGRQGRRGRRR